MSPAQAGLLITCYMIGLFLTSLSLAPRFNLVEVRDVGQADRREPWISYPQLVFNLTCA